jgi:hypothetical protein
MADFDHTIPLTIEELNGIAARLHGRAEQITQVALRGLIEDIHLAARVCSAFAEVRFRVAEIAEKALIYDGAAIRRDLLALLGNEGDGV